jgi:signal transduction histidine kinase
LAVLRDVTERVQAYELLEQRVEERTRELATLLEVSRYVASTLELQPVLELILERLKDIVPYDGAELVALEDDTVRHYARRAPTPVARPDYYQRDKLHFKPILDIIMSGEPVIINDVRGDTPLARVYQSHYPEIMETQLSYVRGWMAVPMALKDRVIGMMLVASREPNVYGKHEADVALAVAQLAAFAIENARLYERAQEGAALEERQRLARELHDSVSQALYGMALGTRTARTLLDRDPSKAAEPLDYVLGLAEAGMAEMRALIFELRPEALQEEGLVAALKKQAAALRARHEIDVDISLCPEPAEPYEVKEALYRIAQESLHNTVKHARAHSVKISLARRDEGIALEIEDDGVGFEPEGEFPGHLGLHSMRERAKQMGGLVELTSTPGAGTRVLVWMPAEDKEIRPSASL